MIAMVQQVQGHLTWQECAERFPLMIRAMKYVACLSETEAACCLREWRDRDLYGGQLIGGEAVTHFGGIRKVIDEAIKHRGLAAKYG